MIDPKGKLLQDLLKDFLTHSHELNLQLATIENKRGELLRLLTFLEDRPLTLETAKLYIQKCQTQDGNVISSIRTKIKTIRAFVNWMFKNKHIPENFAQDIPLPKMNKKLLDIVSMDVAEKIIIAGTEIKPTDDCAVVRRKTDLRLAMRFALRTGLRVNELRTLKGSDLHLYDSPAWFSVISKGGNQDILPFPPDMIKDLEPRLKNDLLFVFSEDNIIEKLQRGAKLMGVTFKITTHTLRHIFSTHLLKQGMPLQEVSRLLRHSSIKITDDFYSHYNINDLALSLNTRHVLIRHALDKSQVLRNIENMINTTGIKDDGRFIVNMNGLANGGLQITINPRVQQV